MLKQLTAKYRLYMQEKKQKEDQEKLMDLIDTARKEMQSIAAGFNEVHDHDLTEYYIYEKRAAELKYKHLLKLYRDHCFENHSFSLETEVSS